MAIAAINPPKPSIAISLLEEALQGQDEGSDGDDDSKDGSDVKLNGELKNSEPNPECRCSDY